MYILVRAFAQKKNQPSGNICLQTETHGIRGLHGDANANTGNGTCSEECPETVRGHTGRRNEVVFAQVV